MASSSRKLQLTEILQSNDLSSLQKAVEEFAISNSSKQLFDSLSYHYPNSFSFKLANLLQQQPPLHIRKQILCLLHDAIIDVSKISSSILNELKKPLLESVKIEFEDSLLPSLCAIIGKVAGKVYRYPLLNGWIELLEFVCSCVSGDKSLNLAKGLLLLAELPVEIVENREFWHQGNYGKLFVNLLMHINLSDPKLKALTFDASLTIMGMSKELGRIEVCDSLMPILLNFIDRHAEEGIILDRVRHLADLVFVGEIFKGKEGELFHRMLRLAELKNASEELKIAAVIVMKKLDELNMLGLIKNLSLWEVQRVLTVSLDVLSCVKDDPEWNDMDARCQEAEMTETFTLGKFLLNWLSFKGGKNAVIPMTIKKVTATYAAHEDWRKRYAGMIAIGIIAEARKKDIIQHFKQVEKLIVELLNDPHQRVLWASIHAVRCLSKYKKLLLETKRHMKFLDRLLTVTKISLCPRVQAYAVMAIRFLITNYGLDKDKMASIGEEIVTILLELLKHEKQKLQEEAVETLKSIALIIPATFCKHYYDKTMESLKGILFDNHGLPKLLLRAKSLDCMSSIVREVVDEYKFKGQEAVRVMESLISLEGELSKTDYLSRSLIIKALDKFCRCPGVDLDRFINKMMSMLLGSALLDIDLRPDMPNEDRGRWPSAPLQPSFADIYICSHGDVNSFVESMRVLTCNIVSCCAVLSYEFSPNVNTVSRIFVRWLGCSSLETQKASISALPNLLHSIKYGVLDEQSQRASTAFIVQSLVEALHKETNSDLISRILRSLRKCVRTCDSFFTTQLIKMIAAEINQILNKIVEMETAREAGPSEGGGEFLPNEEIIQNANHLLKATMETFGDRFLPYVDDNVARFWER